MFSNATASPGSVFARAMNRRIGGLIGICVVVACLTGFGIEAQADTMKCRTAGVATKDETLSVGYEEGHVLGLQVMEGLTFCEDGQVATYKSNLVYDTYEPFVPGRRSQAIGYTIFTFNDGSTFVQRFQSLRGSDIAVPAQVSSELIKGTGRFEGIKGSASGSSTRAPDVKGEVKRYYGDLIFTYTLPPK